jgi:hypothetical protein
VSSRGRLPWLPDQRERERKRGREKEKEKSREREGKKKKKQTVCCTMHIQTAHLKNAATVVKILNRSSNDLAGICNHKF